MRFLLIGESTQLAELTDFTLLVIGNAFIKESLLNWVLCGWWKGVVWLVEGCCVVGGRSLVLTELLLKKSQTCGTAVKNWQSTHKSSRIADPMQCCNISVTFSSKDTSRINSFDFDRILL